MKPMNFVLRVVLFGLMWSARGVSADQADDEAAIRKSVESYTEAFNKQDAKALATHWSPEAVYTDPLSGSAAVGREAIEQSFAANFAKAKGAKLETTVESIRFVSPNVAVENGKARVVVGDEKPAESTYSAIHVKRDGKWLVDRVTEEELPEIVSNYEKLKDLEWMVGKWVDADDTSSVVTTCQWSKNRNFLIRSFSVSVGDRLDKSGIQVIGWDPSAKQIRSWVFDSDGGIGEGVWTKDGDKWFVQAKDTSAGGQKLTSQNVIRLIGKDKFSWRAVDRQVDGHLLPNIDEVVVVRSGEAE